MFKLATQINTEAGRGRAGRKLAVFSHECADARKGRGANWMGYPPLADVPGFALLCLAGAEVPPPVCSKVFNFSR
jgi:hypothetical protein